MMKKDSLKIIKVQWRTDIYREIVIIDDNFIDSFEFIFNSLISSIDYLSEDN